MKLDKYTVGKRYGKALSELIIERNQTKTIYQELLTLHGVYHQVPDVGDILGDDRLEPYEKNNIMGKLVIGFSEMMQNFLRMVYEYHRMYDLLSTIDEYKRRYGEHQGLILGSMTTAIPLSKEQHRTMEEKATQLLEYEQARLVNLIDPSVVGGMIVEANRQVIGDSTRKQLKHTQQKLLK